MTTRIRRTCAVNLTATALPLLSICIFASAATPAPPAGQPNIVLIVADDLGWGVVGYNGSFVRTPNIDRLASQGVQLTHFYVSPMCSPTRVGLMTGRYPMRLGLGRSVIRPWSPYGLPPELQILPELLTTAGYLHRGVFGKWHLGHLRPAWHPLSQGFTTFHGQYNGAADYWTRIREGEMDWHKDAEPLKEKGYTTELIADAACEFVKRHAAGGPFFCYVPFTAPHDPFQAPDKYLAAYPSTAPANDNAVSRDRRTLAAMVTCLDDAIGRILQTLHDSGVADKTLVWFFSDNGGVIRLRFNGPLRRGKLTVYEGGVRVPCAIWWPGVIEGGRKIDVPSINLDVMPTLLRLAGKTVPSGLDGVDISELLTSQVASPPRRDLYFFTGHLGLQREQIAIRSADGWKLVVTGPDIRESQGFRTPEHQVELFRISEDPYEHDDLAAKHPDVVEELGGKLIAFRNSEPSGAMPPAVEPPAGFKPPRYWRNQPETRRSAREK